MTEATTKTIDPMKLAARLLAEQTKLTARLAEIATELEPLTAIVEAAKAEQAARARVEVTGLDAFTTVEFDFGRKDNRKTQNGTVVAFAPAQDKLPARYKIEVGVGFDAQMLVVPARDVREAAPAQDEAAS